jgi:hypothetical protein
LLDVPLTVPEPPAAVAASLARHLPPPSSDQRYDMMMAQLLGSGNADVSSALAVATNRGHSSAAAAAGTLPDTPTCIDIIPNTDVSDFA